MGIHHILGSCFALLSITFSMAVAARFLWGFLNGNIGVAKSYLSEVRRSTAGYIYVLGSK